MSRPCPCTSKQPFDRCCGPFVEGKRLPDTASQLMRSRFTAYALGKVDYLMHSRAAARRSEESREELVAYCRSVSFIALKITEALQGGKDDATGTVTFQASVQINGKRTLHKEKSEFIREDGRWVYLDGVEGK